MYAGTAVKGAVWGEGYGDLRSVVHCDDKGALSARLNLRHSITYTLRAFKFAIGFSTLQS
jgi:hypothetical protein